MSLFNNKIINSLIELKIMSTKNNDNWFNDLTDAANSLFNANDIQLNNLPKIFEDDAIWNRLAATSLNRIPHEKATTLVDVLESYKYQRIKDLDFDDIKAKLILLIGLLIKVASDKNIDEKLTYSIKDSISRNNVAWAVVLIAYIQISNKNKVLTNEKFAKEFIKLTKFLEESSEEYESPPISSASRPAQTQRDMTLILVFGQSHKTIINEIKNKSPLEINDNDYTMLVNKCEWFWYGNKENKPAEIKNEQDNMCWLQLNLNLPNAPTAVTNILHIKDLIKTIKKQPNILVEIKSSDTAFNLDNKVFTKL
jgi:hypothetical protein